MSGTAKLPTGPDASAALSRAVREAAAVNRARISARAGLIAAIPVAGMLSLGTAIGTPSEAVTMGVGAMLSGVAWRAGDGPDTPPVGTMVAATLAIAIATLSGSLTGRWPWLHLGVLAVFCLAAGFATCLGRRGVIPGTHALIAFAVFGRFPNNFGHAIGLAGLVVAGGAAQIVFASLIATPAAWRRQRAALAAAYQTLAVQAGALLGGSAPVASALENAEQVLTAPALFADPDAEALSALVEEGRRIRLELIVLGTAVGQAGRRDKLSPRLRTELNAGLLRVRDALQLIVAAAVEPHADGTATEAAAESLGAWAAARPPLDDGNQDEAVLRLDGRLAAVIGQVTAALRLAVPLAGADIRHRFLHPQLGSRSFGSQFLADMRRIRANMTLQSASGRHAVRLMVVVAGTELLAQRTALPRGYWAVVAAATVLRPGFGATFTRGAERVGGTLVGVVVATLIAEALDPSGWGIVAILVVLSYFTYAVFAASFMLGTAGLTGVVVFLLHAVSPDSVLNALDRGIDTLIGGGLGLLAYALWPTWSSSSAERLIAALIEAQRDYLRAVFSGLIRGRRQGPELLRPLARRARIAWTDAESAVKLVAAEPHRGSVDPQAATATLGALRRLVYGVHALRLDAETAPLEPRPELADLGGALTDSLDIMAASMRTGARTGEQARPPGVRTGEQARPPGVGTGGQARLPPLRQLYRQLPELDENMRVALDELVDATDTVAASLGLELP